MTPKETLRLSFILRGKTAIPNRSRGCPVIFLGIAMVMGILVFSSCFFTGSHDASEALEVAQKYLSAAQSGDIDKARSYWTDINSPDGTWTMVARRDMEHVTLEHRAVFGAGFEITKSKFQFVSSQKYQIGVLKLEVLVKPGGQIKKLEIGLVKNEGHWYIYSIYPGNWG